ncbi:class I SAM-dependent methyltransferase [Methylocapsa palsarum]|uniref:Methyltransferase domain-containing protein n=1 Tax=Methylocapsa palsarum TaxID=1612308 RepID=A0A1I3WSS2_9HYPH|nr:class I SAM-dependent methyltransferase [Methylocapsa palsarum]SFK09501.1 Methyltransferase domain-containing protein [Methylocapsa palsarum]
MSSHCRICKSPLSHTFVDLGVSPLANSYVPLDKEKRGEIFYPLHAYVCDQCFLVQLEEFENPDAIFSNYAYFSSYSAAWLRHADAYAGAMKARFGLGADSKVVEVASNDGYLLQYFLARGVPVLGVEPAANVAKAAIANGVATRVLFFGAETARRLLDEGEAADLMVANNVLAHVPDILDFVAGFRILLKSAGVATFEFPHLLRMIEQSQFDTIYHEHFSYLRLGVVADLMQRRGLRVFDVEQLATHGGSLRVFVCHDAAHYPISPEVAHILGLEEASRLNDLSGYAGFADAAVTIKSDALLFMINARREGKLVCGYGAAAKGNTFLNYTGTGPDYIKVVADRSPHKQGALLPGSRIPVVSPDEMLALKPDYIFILPWNLREEISAELAAARDWGCRFVVAVPTLSIF